MREVAAVLLLLIVYGNVLFGNSSNEKIRLSEEINQYQPTLLPVISPDGRTLYFDRKWHPENSGGIRDDDDVWSSKLNDSSKWTKPERAVGQINLPTSNALLYIFPSGEKALVYGNYRSNSAGYAITRLERGRWTQPVPLIIKDFYTKSRNYSGTMSVDMRVLIMSLEREDSYGGLDLYISFFNDSTGEYSTPKNLGSQINTRDIEFVSFLAYDNRTLYFASSGRRAKGKLDLFLSRRLDESWLRWSEPIPLDSLVNSQWDENSISLTVLGDTAYFVSGDDSTKREGIYSLPLPKSYQPLPYIVLQGTVSAVRNGKFELLTQPIEFTINNFEEEWTFHDTAYDGNYRFVIPYNTQYNFVVNGPGFEFFSFSTNAWNIKETFIRPYNISLKPEATQEFLQNNKPRKQLLGTIHFATNVDTLDANSCRLLKDLRNFFIDNPKSRILVVGHTDEVGTATYNLNLSFRRAKNTANFLCKTIGIARERIQIEGKGKTQPVSQDLSKNRRVEIFIVEYE